MKPQTRKDRIKSKGRNRKQEVANRKLNNIVKLVKDMDKRLKGFEKEKENQGKGKGNN